MNLNISVANLPSSQEDFLIERKTVANVRRNFGNLMTCVDQVAVSSQVIFREPRILHDPVLSSGLEVLIAVNRNNDRVGIPRLSKGVMAASLTDQQPAALL